MKDTDISWFGEEESRKFIKDVTGIEEVPSGPDSDSPAFKVGSSRVRIGRDKRTGILVAQPKPLPPTFRDTICDGCRRNVPESHLRYCSGCRFERYCSEGCQMMRWKFMHKKACRETGYALYLSQEKLSPGHSPLWKRNYVSFLRYIEEIWPFVSHILAKHGGELFMDPKLNRYRPCIKLHFHRRPLGDNGRNPANSHILISAATIPDEDYLKPTTINGIFPGEHASKLEMDKFARKENARNPDYRMIAVIVDESEDPDWEFEGKVTSLTFTKDWIFLGTPGGTQTVGGWVGPLFDALGDERVGENANWSTCIQEHVTRLSCQVKRSRTSTEERNTNSLRLFHISGAPIFIRGRMKDEDITWLSEEATEKLFRKAIGFDEVRSGPDPELTPPTKLEPTVRQIGRNNRTGEFVLRQKPLPPTFRDPICDGCRQPVPGEYRSDIALVVALNAIVPRTVRCVLVLMRRAYDAASHLPYFCVQKARWKLLHKTTCKKTGYAFYLSQQKLSPGLSSLWKRNYVSFYRYAEEIWLFTTHVLLLHGGELFFGPTLNRVRPCIKLRFRRRPLQVIGQNAADTHILTSTATVPDNEFYTPSPKGLLPVTLEFNAQMDQFVNEEKAKNEKYHMIEVIFEEEEDPRSEIAGIVTTHSFVKNMIFIGTPERSQIPGTWKAPLFEALGK
ncbi:hypothetical protein T439DRAFT_345221 [Meredithblackwellia eburnea MCA 4105]